MLQIRITDSGKHLVYHAPFVRIRTTPFSSTWGYCSMDEPECKLILCEIRSTFFAKFVRPSLISDGVSEQRTILRMYHGSVELRWAHRKRGREGRETHFVSLISMCSFLKHIILSLQKWRRVDTFESI